MKFNNTKEINPKNFIKGRLYKRIITEENDHLPNQTVIFSFKNISVGQIINYYDSVFNEKTYKTDGTLYTSFGKFYIADEKDKNKYEKILHENLPF